MRVNDTISGSIVVAFATAMIALAQRFPGFPGQNYGPALFPTVIGVGLLICGGVLIARGLYDRRLRGEPWLHPAASGGRFWPFLLVCGLVLAYIQFSDTTGFILASVAVLLVLYRAFGVKWSVSVPVAVFLTLGIQYFFVQLLRVPLPRGWLDPLL